MTKATVNEYQLWLKEIKLHVLATLARSIRVLIETKKKNGHIKSPLIEELPFVS